MPARYIYAGASKLTGPLVWVRPEEHDSKRAVRYRRYKLHYDRLTHETALFDLQNDWGEKNDISSKHGPLVKSMMKQMDGYLKVNTVGDELPPLPAEEIEKLESLGYI